MYESIFEYMFADVKEYVNAKTWLMSPMENFFSNPKKYFDPEKLDKYSHFAKNTMAFDLGYIEESRDLELRLVFEIIH